MLKQGTNEIIPMASKVYRVIVLQSNIFINGLQPYQAFAKSSSNFSPAVFAISSP
jgi:hypothetical protein